MSPHSRTWTRATAIAYCGCRPPSSTTLDHDGRVSTTWTKRRAGLIAVAVVAAPDDRRLRRHQESRPARRFNDRDPTATRRYHHGPVTKAAACTLGAGSGREPVPCVVRGLRRIREVRGDGLLHRQRAGARHPGDRATRRAHYGVDEASLATRATAAAWPRCGLSSTASTATDRHRLAGRESKRPMSLDGSLGPRATLGPWPGGRKLGLTAGHEPAAESLQADASRLASRGHTLS